MHGFGYPFQKDPISVKFEGEAIDYYIDSGIPDFDTFYMQYIKRKKNTPIWGGF